MSGFKRLLFLFIFYMSVIHYYDGVEGARRFFSTVEDDNGDSELLHQLNILNKPSIKTIHTKEGDIFNCVDMHQQSAFDHPLLTNHKIQMRPSSLPHEIKCEAASSASSSIVLKRLGCPKGTVPIRRVEKEDLKRAKSFSSESSFHQLNDDVPGEHKAIVRTQVDSGQIYYGLQAIVNVYNPDVGQDQSSTAELLIEDYMNGQLYSFRAGWMVAPKLFNDTRTRLFVHWRVYGGEVDEGCYNTFCPGFVQVSEDYPIGVDISDVSKYGEVPQYEIKFSIFQDKESGNWWLTAMDEDVAIGYWPKELLPALVDGSPRIGWGGVAVGSTISSPPMGSGHFPEKTRFDHGCYMKQMKVYASGHIWDDPIFETTETLVDSDNCYGLEYYGNLHNEYQHALQFGGPGGNCGP